MRTRRLVKRKQRAGSYLEKYKWKYIPIAKEFITALSSKNTNVEQVYFTSKYLNFKAMDDDVNDCMKRFCGNETFLEIYEFIKDNADGSFLLSETLRNSTNLTWALSEIEPLGIEFEKFKRMASNYEEYRTSIINTINYIFTLGIVSIFGFFNHDVVNWSSNIENKFEDIILPILMKEYEI
jgi:hypothetical protein